MPPKKERTSKKGKICLEEDMYHKSKTYNKFYHHKFSQDTLIHQRAILFEVEKAFYTVI